MELAKERVLASFEWADIDHRLLAARDDLFAVEFVTFKLFWCIVTVVDQQFYLPAGTVICAGSKR